MKIHPYLYVAFKISQSAVDKYLFRFRSRNLSLEENSMQEMSLRKITPLTGEMADLVHKSSTSYHRIPFINVDGWILPEKYTEFSDTIENFEVRDDDVWVCGFPKTGTTWTQEMVWSIANGLDSERGKLVMEERFPCLETQCVMQDKEKYVASSPAGTEPAAFLFDTLNYIANMPSPRFIKTHLPADLLPRQLRSGEKRAKIVYVCRNAKDTCISLYHFANLFGLKRNFEDHYKLFLGNAVAYGPFWKNVLSFWNRRNDLNMLFLTYENMKEDLPSVVKKTATFLGKDLTNDQVSLLVEHLSFSRMKANPAVNKETLVSRAKKMSHNDPDKVAFIRKGTTGQWKSEMTPEIIKRFDDWTHQHLEGTGLSF